MKNSVHRLLLLGSLLAVPASVPALRAQTPDVKSEMRSLFDSFRDLQPHLVSEQAFSSKMNSEKIHKALLEMTGKFHTLETVPTRYRSQPGFEASVATTAALLSDAAERYREGRYSYARWRLKALSSHCFGCHSTYRVETHFAAEAPAALKSDDRELARFFLASRQFTAAEEALTRVLHNPDYRINYLEALRSLVLVHTRIAQDPKKSVAAFTAILDSTKLPLEDVSEVRQWIEAFKRWGSESKKQKPSLEGAEQLLKASLSFQPESLIAADTVGVLRATALLHGFLENQKITSDQRRRALFLLGLGYSQLPGLFVEGWPEMYLEQVINEYPATREAQQAFKLYKNLVTVDFTGSGGTAIPDEVELHVEELRRKAFNVPTFSGKT